MAEMTPMMRQYMEIKEQNKMPGRHPVSWI